LSSSIRLGKIAGIDVSVHYSWFVVLALVTWSLARGFLPNFNPIWSDATNWGLGLFAALLLFASVLIHELAHSVVAKARGFEVEGITLFILGGVSNIKVESGNARDEFIIAVVGPISSLFLAGIFWALLWVIPDGASRQTAVIFYLALINTLLAVFNLLPAFPLDGGRVFRSILWGATGNMVNATRIAAWGGQVIGVLMIAGGVFMMFQQNYLGGMWFVFIGWFLQSTAMSSVREIRERNAVKGYAVTDVMERDPYTILPDASIAQAVYGNLTRAPSNTLAVCEWNDQIIGFLTIKDVSKVPEAEWPFRRVRGVMTPASARTLKPSDDLQVALDIMSEHSLDQAAVLLDGRLVGILTREGIARHLRTLRNLGIHAHYSQHRESDW